MDPAYDFFLDDSLRHFQRHQRHGDQPDTFDGFRSPARQRVAGARYDGLPEFHGGEAEQEHRGNAEYCRDGGVDGGENWNQESHRPR